MAKVLYVWELGGGLGHLSPLLPIVRQLIEQNHEVHLALRSLDKARLVFGDLPVTYWQAPIQQIPGPVPHPLAANVPQILINTCFRTPDEFHYRLQAWSNIFRGVEPDLILANLSPTALLAMEQFDFQTAILGFGFEVPAKCEWFPGWRPELKLDPESLHEQERGLLNTLNAWRVRQGISPDEHLSELFTKTNHSLLATFPELDPFGPRKAEYLGIWFGVRGASVQWPDPPSGATSAKKVLAYLKPTDQIAPLCQILRNLGTLALLYVPGMPQSVIQECETEQIQFVAEPINLAEAARECDLAILNSTHASVATFLLCGKPMALFPLFLEQRLTCECVMRMGAAHGAQATQMGQSQHLIEQVLTNDHFAKNARAFQERYPDYNFDRCAEEVSQRVLSFLK